MIHPDSRSLAWMQQVASENNFNDITLIEKTIRAFSLLESLVLSVCIQGWHFIDAPFEQCQTAFY